MEKLLVVEDDEVTAAFLADNLEADGFHVATAAGVGEAVRAIEVRSPALVILDVMLEDGNGLAVLDRLRAADSGPPCGWTRRFPCSCCPAGPPRSTACAASRAGPTTTLSSRSATRSWWRACARSCAARRGGRGAARSASGT